MKFGGESPLTRRSVPLRCTRSARVALVLKKGTLIGPIEAAALEAAGIKDIVVARLEPGDVSEDVAAAEIEPRLPGRA